MVSLFCCQFRVQCTRVHLLAAFLYVVVLINGGHPYLSVFGIVVIGCCTVWECAESVVLLNEHKLDRAISVILGYWYVDRTVGIECWWVCGSPAAM